MIAFKKPLLLTLSVFVLASCGGGGGGGGGVTSPSSMSSVASSADSSVASSADSSVASSADSSAASSNANSGDTVGTAEPISDRTLGFATEDAGVSKPIDLWGVDTAWQSFDNVERGKRYMGKENTDVIRISFMPTEALVSGQLGTDQTNRLRQRLAIASVLKSDVKVVMNADNPTIDASLGYTGAINAQAWADMMDAHKQYIENNDITGTNLKVVSAGVYNEPDCWCSNQGTKQNFYDTLVALRAKPSWDGVRLSGGNTLSTDSALEWYGFNKALLEEGNTHQLSGSFDNFINFFATVKANGDDPMEDEMHNVMEAIVGAQYGVKTGIWWGTAERTRGEFARASDGMRLGYSDHRINFTAAAVYRAPNGQIQAFGGTSERQGATTKFRLVSKDRDVFYDGQGPQREYTMTMPGGAPGSYQDGQTNAEGMVNITYGEDVQPVVNGRYIIVNKASKKVIEVAGGTSDDGAYIKTADYAGSAYQQWDLTPLPIRVGGDFSYFQITSAGSFKAMDVYGWELNTDKDIRQWSVGGTTGTGGGNQHWYLKYASDGYFRICSRHSTYCAQPAGASVSTGVNLQQAIENDASDAQLWRLIPAGQNVEFTAPAAPTGLMATAQSESIRLDWAANSESDLKGYTLVRAVSGSGEFEIVARNLTATSFVDHGVATGVSYDYKLRAGDKSLNQSGYSNEVTSASTGEQGLVAYLPFDNDTLDTTSNKNHGAIAGTLTYGVAKVGSKSLDLDGATQYVRLPATVANHDALTISTWVYWTGTTSTQRIFDFGSDSSTYISLNPKGPNGKLRLSYNDGSGDQYIESASVLTASQWVHVAVVFDGVGAKLYVNGAVAASTASALQPMDIKPVVNLVGAGQSSVTSLFKGRIDDFRIYNYALDDAGVQAIYTAN